MIQTLNDIEYDWFLWLNSFHSSIFDELMSIITYRLTWLPLYAFLIYFLFKTYGKSFWQNLIFIILSVGLSDRITSVFIKPYFQRLRPCHDTMIQKVVHIVGDCGGEFGFASSHAANSFALFMCFYLLNGYSKLNFFLLFWAIIVSYSRIYIGVHFPTDIIVGASVGMLISVLIYQFKNSIKPISLKLK